MKAEKVIKYRLSHFTGITDLVGVSPNDRIYPVAMPQDVVYPCIYYKRITSRRLQGTHDDPGYCYATIQVVCLAKTADELLTLNEQVRLALERYGSDINGTLIDGVLVYDITIGSEATDYEGALEAFYTTTDFTVMHKE